MLTLEQFSQLAAIVSAMADVLTVGRETFSEYLRRRERDPDTGRKAALLAETFSTYSDDEIEAIRQRILECRKRFVDEGAGEARRKCLCSVLRDVRDGNGGQIPDNDWEKWYDQLKCAA